ncbi:MAG: tyrosine-type recombinase/integrase [Pseudomonadales bacterium]
MTTDQSAAPRGVRAMRGKWQIIYQVEGERIYETLPLLATEKNLKAAVRIRSEKIAQRRYGQPPNREDQEDRSHRTFTSVAQAYLDATEVKQSTRNSYRDSLNNYWLPYFHKLDIKDVSTPGIRQADREIEWPSVKTRKNSATALRQVFSFAVEEGYIADNPALRLRIRRGQNPKPTPDPYTPEDRDKLLNWLVANASQTVHAYYQLAFFSGMRTGELLALTWEDYDGKSFMVSKSRTRREIVSTKTDETRRVLIPSFVAATIGALPSRFKREFVFLNQYERPYLSGYHLNQVFTEAHKKTNVPRSSSPNYPWRHTYASIGLTRGLEPAFLAHQLGHNLKVFLDSYAKWINSEGDLEMLERMK